jgi:hypothetical protein
LRRDKQPASGRRKPARIVADRGCRGHTAPPDHTMKVYLSGQKRGVTGAIKRDRRWRSAVEPVVGHAKSDHRMDRNFLKGSYGDAAKPLHPPTLSHRVSSVVTTILADPVTKFGRKIVA